jgi:hypothetical protein
VIVKRGWEKGWGSRLSWLKTETIEIRIESSVILKIEKNSGGEFLRGTI